MVSKAKMRYLRSSPQKTRLVVDQIRGLDANKALATLDESRKSVARDVSKLLRSAVANAQKGDQRVDADTLFVSRAWVDCGPSLKRSRAATFGRAFRILHRTCHITVELEARPESIARVSRAKRRARSARVARKGAAGAAAAPEPSPQTEGRTKRTKGRTGAPAGKRKKAAPKKKDEATESSEG
jgi:large subunit ribosomal protein L22